MLRDLRKCSLLTRNFVSFFKVGGKRRSFCTNEHSNEEQQKNVPLSKSITPAMRQYHKMKQSVPGYILLFQMGDFYEIFYEDALTASKLLDLTLTSRSKSDHAIPMCGIPLHTVETYIGKLIQKGQMVAVCDQIMEGNKPHPAQHGRRRKTQSPIAKAIGGSGGVVKREITRLVSPGTLIEDHLLLPRSNNFLASIYYTKEHSKDTNPIGLTWMDLSTGSFFYTSLPTEQELRTELHRINPVEIIASYELKSLLLLSNSSVLQDAIDRAASDPILQQTIKDIAKQREIKEWHKGIADCLRLYRVTPRANEYFNEEISRLQLAEQIHGASHELNKLAHSEVCAAGALLNYVIQTQKGGLPSISAPQKHIINDVMHIDAATFQCLELVKSNSSDSPRTLLNTIDLTVTGPGARLLSSRLVSPLVSPSLINDRLDAIEFFVKNEFVTESLRELLKQCFDIERSLQRISLRKCGPRDLTAISQTIAQLEAITQQLNIGLQSNPNKIIQNQTQELLELSEKLNECHTRLSSALVDNPPMSIHNGGFVRSGYCTQLDQIQTLHTESKDIIGRLQTKYRQILSINGLRIKTNLVLGMHIEIPTSHHDKVLQHNQKIQEKPPEDKLEKDPLDLDVLLSDVVDYRHLLMHCQTMPSYMRYKTEEISLLDQRIQRAEFEVKEHEDRIFRELVDFVLTYSAEIRKVAQLIANVDVSSSLGLLARLHSYCRPVITTENAMNVRNGRHPVVEMMQQARQQGSAFTPNDLVMDKDKQRVFLLTGPNMGGKSTYLRQVAIHAILAQSGSYIPAESATIGIIDRIFSRVGAADDVKNDQSTFMMEMQEAASILKMATPRSLVIVDELGRGTSTMEGLSIAWAVLEYLHNTNRCRTIFATHYHELAKLQNSLQGLHCYQMQIKENHTTGVIAFLHKVIEGVADKSYGVHVAKLAGVPTSVTTRADQILEDLMSGSPVTPKIFPNTFPTFGTDSVTSAEDDTAHYIKIDKNNGNFADAYDLLCNLAFKEQSKE